MSEASCGLLELPNALLEQIILGIEQLRDVASFAQTCRRIRTLVYEPSDSHLWRLMFLSRYANPRVTARLLHREIEVDWAQTLKARRQAISRIARSSDCRDAVTSAPFEAELGHFVDALRYERPGLGDRAAVQMILEAAHAQPTLTFSGRPGLLAQSWPAEPEPQPFDELISQLSCYFGVDRQRFTLQQRQGARARVYMLNAWRENAWSPFDPKTGRVEWHRMESLMLVACTNATELCQASTEHNVLPPCRLECARPFTQYDWDVVAGEDWAGITGVWRRCINFMDWHVLFAYQRALDRGGLTSVVDFFQRFENPEAVHVHAWRLTVSQVVKNPAQPHFPDLYWQAEMVDSQIYHTPPTLRGVVHMTEHGDVKWTSITRFEGLDAYCSTGLQVGGVRSAFGVVGLWSGIHHEHGDPAGPNYMWKCEEADANLASVASQ